MSHTTLPEPARQDAVIYRHSVAARILHWVNAACVFLVLMSGLQIFNAHPRLYWGQYGANPDSPILQLSSHPAPGENAIPHWATIPSWYDLANGRRWHFFFAWLLVFNSIAYLLLAGRHIWCDLVPSRRELHAGRIARDFWNHVRLRFPAGEAARHYNILQKLAYMGAIFVLAPMMLLTGLAMSPGMDAAAPWLVDLFGGRQSARSLHFFTAMAIVLFIAVHLLMVIAAGPVNELRSMITGRFVLPRGKSQ